MSCFRGLRAPEIASARVGLGTSGGQSRGSPRGTVASAGNIWRRRETFLLVPAGTWAGCSLRPVGADPPCRRPCSDARGSPRHRGCEPTPGGTSAGSRSSGGCRSTSREEFFFRCEVVPSCVNVRMHTRTHARTRTHSLCHGTVPWLPVFK